MNRRVTFVGRDAGERSRAWFSFARLVILPTYMGMSCKWRGN
jgi:hypothetical protein